MCVITIHYTLYIKYINTYIIVLFQLGSHFIEWVGKVAWVAPNSEVVRCIPVIAFERVYVLGMIIIIIPLSSGIEIYRWEQSSR